MAARLVVNNDRTPDYFYIDELLGDKPVIFVAEKMQRIVGTVAIVFRNIQFKGKNLPIAYIGGIKIENPSENTLLTFRLMKYVMDYLLDTPIKFGFILVIGANRAMEALLSGRAGIPEFDMVGKYQVKNIFPMPFINPGREFNIRSARTDDIPVLSDLYKQGYQNYELTPDWTPEYLRSLYDQKDYLLENTLLAFDNGIPVATISLWDQSNFKNTVISHYRGIYAFLKIVMSPFRLVPAEGQPLSELAIRHLVYKNNYQTAGSALLKWTIRNYRKKYHFFRCGFPMNSPQADVFNKFRGLSIPVNFYTVFRPDDPDRDDMVQHLKQSFVWEDLAVH